MDKGRTSLNFARSLYNGRWRRESAPSLSLFSYRGKYLSLAMYNRTTSMTTENIIPRCTVKLAIVAAYFTQREKDYLRTRLVRNQPYPVVYNKTIDRRWFAAYASWFSLLLHLLFALPLSLRHVVNVYYICRENSAGGFCRVGCDCSVKKKNLNNKRDIAKSQINK